MFEQSAKEKYKRPKRTLLKTIKNDLNMTKEIVLNRKVQRGKVHELTASIWNKGFD